MDGHDLYYLGKLMKVTLQVLRLNFEKPTGGAGSREHGLFNCAGRHRAQLCNALKSKFTTLQSMPHEHGSGANNRQSRAKEVENF